MSFLLKEGHYTQSMWAERAENRVAERGAGVAENDGAGAKRGAGGRGEGTERRAGWIGRSQPSTT